jgi:hypothetical protein
MGNAQNKGDGSTTDKSLTSIIDFIATDYILTQNFTDMYNLTDEKYCDKLLILTSKIISKYLSNIEIDRMVTKRVGDELTDDVEKNKILFLRKKSIKEFEKIDPELKQTMCNGISKFYIKIAQLFASITSMVNPTYTYRSRHGEDVTFDTFDKAKLEQHNISLSTKPTIAYVSFCGRRIDCLTNGLNLSTIKNRSDRFSISPTFCKVNKTKKGTIVTLDKEPGIGELEHLFYDTYDWSSKRFSKMSDNAQKEYDDAVQRFWNIWTSEEDRKKLPKPKKFSDITMKHFHHTQGCQGSHEQGKRGFQTSFYRRAYTGSREEDSLFGEYIDNVTQIMESAQKHEKELLDILDEVFKYDVNPLSGKKEITLTPNLDMKNLKEIIARLRTKQVDMYIECEQKFYKGFKIFEKIVADRMVTTTNLRQESLSKESTAITHRMKEIIASDKNISESDVEELNKKLGIVSGSKQYKKDETEDDSDSDDDTLTDDIAASHLKGMFKKILKKHPDLISNKEVDEFGKYRGAFKHNYQQRLYKKFFRDVEKMDKYKQMDTKDTDKVLDSFVDIITQREGKINKNLSKFKDIMKEIRADAAKDALHKKWRHHIRNKQDETFGNNKDPLGSDTESDSDSDTDSDTDVTDIRSNKELLDQYRTTEQREREKEKERMQKKHEELRAYEKFKKQEKKNQELKRLQEMEELARRQKLKEFEELIR